MAYVPNGRSRKGKKRMAEKKAKKISVNAFEEAAGVKYGETTQIGWNGLTITVKKRLSLKEMVWFVDDVVDNCFDDEDGTYYPQYEQFLIDKNIIERYTNLTLPQNIEKQYELLISTNLTTLIIKEADFDQYEEIINIIDKKIEHRRLLEAEGAKRRIDDAYRKIVEIAEQLDKMFADVTPDDIAKVVGAVADGKIDEHKIVDAYFEKKAEAGKQDGAR